MGKVSRNILSVLMAVIVLITSNGIVLASHTCLKKADTKVSLFQNKSCCGKSKKSCESMEQNAVKSNCCVSSVSYHKVSVNSIPAKKQVVQSQLILDPATTFTAAQLISVFIPALSAKPPLLYSAAQDLPVIFSSFRI